MQGADVLRVRALVAHDKDILDFQALLRRQFVINTNGHCRSLLIHYIYRLAIIANCTRNCNPVKKLKLGLDIC